MTIGQTIGPYQVRDKLGSGGMGDVYRARDSKLGRDVALKVLPASFVSDPERVARFEREARTLASLNHPHIAHVYGFEPNPLALVMELVPGDDLSSRIARGALPIPEALAIARQIADALEFAHAQGVVHRDLKPGNIKIRPDGAIKVLDFGLAKALSPTDVPEQLDAATMTSPAMTLQGVILGTAAYMAPEQARGQAVDQRADIWAFGVVLYEMLTGRLAFAAPTVTDTLARVIEREPDWTALPTATPAAIRTLLRRCLEKDPRKRAPHIGIARLECDDALSGPTTVHAAVADSSDVTRRRPIGVPVAAAVVLTVAAAAAGYFLRPRLAAAPALPYRSLLLIDENLNPRAPSHRFRISPDGRRLAYVGSGEPSREVHLWIRVLSDDTSQAVTGTEDAATPFWSPDSRSIAYYANGQLWRVEVGGGRPEKICDIPNVVPQAPSGAWGPGDVIVFSNGKTLWRVSARGGQPEELTTLEAGQETQHGFPWFLPGAGRVVFTAYRGLEPVGVYALDLESRTRRRILEGGSNVQFADGRLIFLRGTALMAQPFDFETLQFSGVAVTLADPVLANIAVVRAGAFSVSETGALVYVPQLRRGGSRLVWATRDGKQTLIQEMPTTTRGLSVTSDGSRAANLPMNFEGQTDLWLVDLNRGVPSRLTHDVRPMTAVWSRDGRTLYYSAYRSSGALNIYRRGDLGTGPEEVVFESDVDKWLTSVSSDNRTFIYESLRPGQGWDIFSLTLEATPRVTPVAQSPFLERAGQLSNDGQWLAFAMNMGQGDEVYIAKHPTGAHRTQISSGGGRFPRWLSTKELIFHDGRQLVSAGVTLRADGVDVGAVTPLFPVAPPEGFARAFYDVTADGRFVISLPSAQLSTAPLGLLTNWQAIGGR